MGLLAATFSGFALALIAPLVGRVGARASGWILALLPAGLTVWLLRRIPDVEDGGSVEAALEWAPELGLRLSFRLDALSLLFALAVTAVGAAVLVYAGAYLAGEPGSGEEEDQPGEGGGDRGRRSGARGGAGAARGVEGPGAFHSLLLLFMASMLGLVLAENLLALFVFWELTSVSSFLLIGFRHTEEKARKAAWKALMITAVGGQALLAGFLLLAAAGGSFEIGELVAEAGAVRAHPLYVPAALLVLVGAFTKSAQAPFHFWLPAAMEAPTPVSAYLHSAAMVKAGVYLIARLTPLLGGTAVWTATTAAVGAATMALGAVLALEQTKIKRVLAYATVSILGALVLLLGIGTEAALAAALLYLVVHVLYKAGLFLVSGSLDHGAGATEVDEVRGLAGAMPLTATASILAALSMVGLPPLLGFPGKEELWTALLERVPAAAAGGAAPVLDAGAPVLLALAVVSFALLVAVAGVVGVRPFLGDRRAPAERPHEPAAELWIAPLALGAAALVLALHPSLLGRLLEPAVVAAGGGPVDLHLSAVPEWGAGLLLSGASLAGGAVLFVLRRPLRRGLGRLGAGRRGPERGYDAGESGVRRLADLQTAVLQHGYLRYYVLVTVVAILVLVGGALVATGGWPDGGPGPALRVPDASVAVLLVGTVLVAALARSVVVAVIALGAVGLGEVLVYALFGAPDLAMAQVLVQTFVIVMFVFLLSTVSRSERVGGPSTRTGERPRADGDEAPVDEAVAGAGSVLGRLRDGVVALLVGGVMAVLVLLAGSNRLGPRTVSDAFLAHGREGVGSATAAGTPGSRNVVNRILVDFRALDTLGELMVFAAAAIGVSLLVGWHRRGDIERARPVVLTNAIRLLAPLLLLFSVFLLLRGGRAPGGGFSGGLVAAGAFTVAAFAFGARFARGLARVHPPRLIPAGLLLMASSGLVAAVRGEPFLSEVSTGVTVPGLGVELATPLLFETGVYVTVLGGALTVILYLARERP